MSKRYVVQVDDTGWYVLDSLIGRVERCANHASAKFMAKYWNEKAVEVRVEVVA